MTVSIKADAGGNFGAILVNGNEVMRVGSDNSGQLTGFRNKLINGAFNIWQRGTSFAAAGYTADRWLYSGTGFTIAQLAISAGDALSVASRYICRLTASAAVANNTFVQKIENVHGWQGAVSFSGILRLNSGTLSSPINVYAVQNFGTGGSPSAEVATLIGTINPTGSASRYSLTGTLPTLVGTLGSNGDDNLSVKLVFPAGTFQLDMGDFQFEKSSIATPFEQRPIGLELSLCQRYYEVGNGYGLTYGMSGTFLQRFTIPYRVTKRVAPTASATYVSGTASVSYVIAAYADTMVVAMGSSSGGQELTCTWTAEAEL